MLNEQKVTLCALYARAGAEEVAGDAGSAAASYKEVVASAAAILEEHDKECFVTGTGDEVFDGKYVLVANHKTALPGQMEVEPFEKEGTNLLLVKRDKFWQLLDAGEGRKAVAESEGKQKTKKQKNIFCVCVWLQVVLLCAFKT